MRSRKLLSCLLLFLLFLGCFATPAAAAETADPAIEAYNSNVAGIAATLEERFNVDIVYPIRKSGYAAVGSQTLATLNSSLSFVTPQVVSEISGYFKRAAGARITVSFEYPPLSLSGTTLASFSVDTATLRVYIPYSDGSMMITGTNPTAIVHEMGHAFHEYVQYRYGAEDLMATWGGLSQPYRFSGGNTENPDPTVFATRYASSSYYEDFAETFAQAFTANRPGLGISEFLTNSSGERTKLGSKMRWMERFVTDYIEDHESAVSSIQLIYSTPGSLQYGGRSMKGNSLQYIGFAEPNGVYAAVVDHLGVSVEASRWISEIGGWYIKSTAGEEYYVFPGGSFVKLTGGI